MDSNKDWRLRNQLKYLYKEKLRHLKYFNHGNSDHDHCEFCFDKFALFEGCLKEGYCTLDYYHWICEECFRDFKDMFQWTVEEDHNNKGSKKDKI